MALTDTELDHLADELDMGLEFLEALDEAVADFIEDVVEGDYE